MCFKAAVWLLDVILCLESVQTVFVCEQEDMQGRDSGQQMGLLLTHLFRLASVLASLASVLAKKCMRR